MDALPVSLMAAGGFLELVGLGWTVFEVRARLGVARSEAVRDIGQVGVIGQAVEHDMALPITPRGGAQPEEPSLAERVAALTAAQAALESRVDGELRALRWQMDAMVGERIRSVRQDLVDVDDRLRRALREALAGGGPIRRWGGLVVLAIGVVVNVAGNVAGAS